MTRNSVPRPTDPPGEVEDDVDFYIHRINHQRSTLDKMYKELYRSQKEAKELREQLENVVLFYSLIFGGVVFYIVVTQ